MTVQIQYKDKSSNGHLPNHSPVDSTWNLKRPPLTHGLAEDHHTRLAFEQADDRPHRTAQEPRGFGYAVSFILGRVHHLINPGVYLNSY